MFTYLAIVLTVVVVAGAILFATSLLFALPVYYLWNWLVPTLFDLPSVTFWQAWGLNLLSSFLIRSVSWDFNKKKGK